MPPERFCLTAYARNHSWELRWNGREMIYEDCPPPVDLFPTPGQERELNQTAIDLTDAGWANIEAAFDAGDVWNWNGDYAAHAMGGLRWQLNIAWGNRSVQCEGMASADLSPTGADAVFAAIAEATAPHAPDAQRLADYVTER